MSVEWAGLVPPRLGGFFGFDPLSKVG